MRRVMIEGVSGLLSVHHGRERPRYEPSKHQLVWPTGAIAQVFSAEDPDGLRGPQFDAAWCDEVAKWRYPDKTWDMLQFALRLGTVPQLVATTTPRPIPLLKRLLEDAATVVTRAATIDNTENLAPTFVAEMTRRYAGTALGRQELLGELVDDTSGSLWRRDWIDAHRVANAPELTTIVVAVDPPVTVRTVRATRGKWLRAEPIAALYAEGRVAHVGTFEALEDQMCLFGVDGLAKGRSPDRLDALVWALTDLMIGAVGRPGVRRL